MIQEAVSFFNPGDKAVLPLYLSLHSNYVPPFTLLRIFNKINSLRNSTIDMGINN
jgi:hypothetical protein